MDNKQMLNLADFLQSGLDKLNLKLPQTTKEKILVYVALLNQWSKVYNLTAIRDPKSVLIRHVFDSLAIVPFIIGPDILDFGSGAGVPGIPLALALPEWNFVLLDSSRKKTTFLNHVMLSLNIKNLKVVNKRIEEFRFDRGFATIVTRATMKAEVIIDKTESLCAKSGQVLMMKGKKPLEELQALTRPFTVHRVEVPYLQEERHLIRVLN